MRAPHRPDHTRAFSPGPPLLAGSLGAPLAGGGGGPGGLGSRFRTMWLCRALLSSWNRPRRRLLHAAPVTYGGAPLGVRSSLGVAVSAELCRR